MPFDILADAVRVIISLYFWLLGSVSWNESLLGVDDIMVGTKCMFSGLMELTH